MQGAENRFVLHQRSLVGDEVKEVRRGQRCGRLRGEKGRGRELGKQALCGRRQRRLDERGDR